MDASILNYTVNDNVGDFLSKDKKLYINGDWVDPSSGKSFDVEDPATGKKIATCSAGNSKDIDAAVKAARVAFDSGAWTDVPNNEKGKIIWKNKIRSLQSSTVTCSKCKSTITCYT